MVDLHSHILPAMDDGAENTTQSIQMLRALAVQGVTVVAATPHFKPRSRVTVSEFLARRQACASNLAEAIALSGERLPEIRLGCEVTLSVELSQIDGLRSLCYEGTNFLLVELDQNHVGSWVINSLYELSTNCSVTPVIAHIDRYFSKISDKLLREIIELNCPLQFNASAMSDFFVRRKLKKLMSEYPDSYFLVGSDCHDTSRRAPDMGIFKHKCIKHFGQDTFEDVCESSRLLLNNRLIV